MDVEEEVTALHAYLSYSDAAAGISWLEALGFVTLVRQEGENGRVLHAELRLGQAVVMVSSADADYDVPPLKKWSTGSGIYLVTSDVGSLHERAVRAGGRSVFPPEETEWGSTRARVLDPEGHEWSFGTYAPGRS
ncbi:VOC family protein [Streptomyces sp. NPDC047141]|uniref:VOC family protein n=1 Tax=unclassified Streptomyces TaxID=2593676 RepID=UPI0034063D2B